MAKNKAVHTWDGKVEEKLQRSFEKRWDFEVEDGEQPVTTADLWLAAGRWVDKQHEKYAGLFSVHKVEASQWNVIVTYTVPSEEDVARHRKIGKLRKKLDEAYAEKRAAVEASRKKKK